MSTDLYTYIQLFEKQSIIVLKNEVPNLLDIFEEAKEQEMSKKA